MRYESFHSERKKMERTDGLKPAKYIRFGLTWNAEIIVVQDEFFDIADFVESFAANFLDTIVTKINNL